MRALCHAKPLLWCVIAVLFVVQGYICQLESKELQEGSLPADYDCSSEETVSTIEDLFVFFNCTAISGNSALIVGFGYAGELTAFRWPSPSYFDHIFYHTPIPILGKRCKSACACRKLLHNGAEETMGSFAGIYLPAEDGGRVHWFRDASWQHGQRYMSPWSNVVVTIAEHPAIGLRVEILNFVHPDKDVLVRHYRVVGREPSSCLRGAKLMYYENMAPVTNKTPYLPLDDWALEDMYDFAVMYYEAGDALVHFRPQQPDASLLPRLDTSQEEIDQYIERLDRVFGYEPGRAEVPIYLAIGADFSGLGGTGRSDGHQCGLERLKAPSSEKLQAAYYDSLDGELQATSVAYGKVDGALMKEISEDTADVSFTVYLTASNRAADALALLDEARRHGWESLLEETEKEWSQWIGKAVMPATDDPEILAVCKRTLVSIRQSWDKRTGAFVASIASQPPYHLNWPRDGAFLSFAMDVAGFADIAASNLYFLAEVQRNCNDVSSPRYDVWCALEGLFQQLWGWRLDGTYEMTYYADGMPGGPLFFEIDNSAFAAWAMMEHYRFLEEAEGYRYLCGDGSVPGGLYESIRRTASSLGDCRDAGDTSGLQCKAFEDDNVELSRTLTGAVSVYMAMDAAIEAGSICGEDPHQIRVWEERRDEIRSAIEQYFWDEQQGRYVGGGSDAYLLWPARVPVDPERRRRHEAALWSDARATLSKERLLGAYVGKAVLGLAKVGWGAEERTKGSIEWALDVLLKEIPTAATLHYGEIYFAVDTDGDGEKEFSNRVALPHIWEGALAYLAAMAYYGPAEAPARSYQRESAGSGCMCSVQSRYDHDDDLDTKRLSIDAVVFSIPFGMIALMRRRVRIVKTLAPHFVAMTPFPTP